MRRLARWLMRLAFLATAAITAWWAVATFVLPDLVERRILGALESIGLDGSAARVDRLGSDRTLISNLIIGSDERLTIDSAEVTYDIAGALKGHVNTIRLSGAWLRLAVRDGAIDLGQLARLGANAGPASASPGLTFDRIELRSSAVLVDLPDRGLFLPITGSIERGDDGWLDVDLRGELVDRRLTLTGRLKLDAERTLAQNVRIDLSGGEVPVSAMGWTLRDAAFTIQLDAEAADNKVTATLRDGSTVTAAGTSWKISPAFGRPLLSLDASARPASANPAAQASSAVPELTTFAARFESQSSITLGDSDASVTVPHAMGDVLVHLGGPTGYRVEGTVTLEQASAQHRRSGVRAEAIRATLPITLHAPGDEPGVFTVGRITLGDDVLQPIVGTIQIIDGTLSARADWKLPGSLNAAIAAEFTGATGWLSASIPVTTIDDPHALADALTPLRGLELNGTVGVDASIRYADGVLTPHIGIDLDGASLASREWELAVDGIHGRIAFDRLDPISTSSNQRLTAARIHLGKLELHDADAFFRLESDRTVFIEKARWSLGDSGRFLVHAIRFNLDRPVIDTDLFIEDLNLGDWLSVLTDKAVTATGSLYGRVPVAVEFDEDRPILRLGHGYLNAESGGGELRFADAQTVSELLVAADPRFAPGGELAEVRTDAVEALADFGYSMFRFDLIDDTDGDGLMLRMQTKGEGRSGKKRQIGGLTVRLHNFEEAANWAIFAKLSLQQRVNRSLDRFFQTTGEPPPAASTGAPDDSAFDKFFD